jgi:hypothetical protein
VNWFPRPIHLDWDDFQYIVDKLEKVGQREPLRGVDEVWFVTKIGQQLSS